MKFRLFPCIVLAVMPLSAWGFATLPPQAPKPSGTATVTEVTDGERRA